MNPSHQPPVAAAEQTCLSLTLFGGIAAEAGGRAIPLRSRRARAVLALLAQADSGILPRERVRAMLWSRAPVPRGQTSLRQIVREIRRGLEEAGLALFRPSRLYLTLDPGAVRSDLRAALELAQDGAVHPALMAGPRPVDRLMAGFDTLGEGFRLWVQAQREAAQSRLVHALDSALATGRDGVARALLNLEPTHEAACRAWMRLCAASGDLAQAMAAFDLLAAELRARHNLLPSPATIALHDQLRGA